MASDHRADEIDLHIRDLHLLAHLICHILRILGRIAVTDKNHLLLRIHTGLLHLGNERIERLAASAHLGDRDQMPLIVHMQDRLDPKQRADKRNR